MKITKFLAELTHYGHLDENGVSCSRGAITQLANCLKLDTTKNLSAASVIQTERTHHQTQEETGFVFVDRCYQLLCEHCLSPAEYLYFRNVVQAERIPELSELQRMRDSG